MTDDRRRQRHEIRLIQRESTWLQKALFALGKAQEARELLQSELDLGEGEYLLPIEDGELPMEAFEDALESRIKELMELVRERRKAVR